MLLLTIKEQGELLVSYFVRKCAPAGVSHITRARTRTFKVVPVGVDLGHLDNPGPFESFNTC